MRLDEMCHANAWDQVMHPILLIGQDEEEDNEMGDNFERNVRLY